MYKNKIISMFFLRVVINWRINKNETKLYRNCKLREITMKQYLDTFASEIKSIE